jgi:hypothetical protein
MPEQQFTDLGLQPPTGWDHTERTMAANKRIRLADTPAKAGLQMQLEHLVVLHSIRRILMATLVVAPLLAAAVAVVILLSMHGK